MRLHPKKGGKAPEEDEGQRETTIIPTERVEYHRYQDLNSSYTCKRSCFDVLLGASIELYQHSGMTSKVNKGPEDPRRRVQSPACPAVKLQIVVPAHLSFLFKAPALYQHESSTRQG